MAGQDEGHVGAAPGAEYQPPYRLAGLVGLAAFALYVITLAPTTAFWDTSEYIATAHILGIPHPPGNPVFVLLARTWEILLAPLPLSVAVKINLFSAAMSATASAFWFLVCHRVLAFFSEEEMFRRLGAGAAVLISATTFTVWNQSVVNEKVYTVSVMTIALLTWLIFRWRDNIGKGKDDNLLILIVFLLALSLGNHLMAFLVAPAMVLFIIWVHPRALLRWQVYAFAGLAWALGLSAQLYLPIRADSRPIISEADPRCESVWNAGTDIVRLHPPVSMLKPETVFRLTKADDKCVALAESLRREQYRKAPLNMNPIDYPRQTPRDLKLVTWQFINWWQYFDWQWARSFDGSNVDFAWKRFPFTLVFLLLGLYGAWKHYHADRTSWIYFAVLFASVWFGLIIYLNFKYGYSVPATTIDPATGGTIPVPREWREVRERDYFFIASFSQWGLWAGIGLASLWQAMAKLNAGVKARLSLDNYKRAAPVLILALLPLFLNWKYASRAGDYAARDWAYNLLMSIEPYGIVFTNGDNDTFPLWYLQEVEGLRQDVTVIVYSYLATPWYSKQLRDLTTPCEDADPDSDATLIICQRPFEPEKAIDLYQGRDWPKPSRSILDWNDAQIAQVPECYPRDNFGQCALFPDTVALPITDQVQGFIPAGDYLLRNDYMVARILQNSAGDRPIYFASTTGTYEKFNLQPWMVRQGVGYKVETADVQPSETIVIVPQQMDVQRRVLPFWIDVPRTQVLLNEYYLYRDMPDWTFWPDLSTNGIPLQYFQAYRSLTLAHLVKNQRDLAAAAEIEGMKFVYLALGPIDMPMITGPVPEEAVGAPAADNPSQPIEIPMDTGEEE
jgi:hypothetical protein